MAQITDLPPEILSMIFQNLQYTSESLDRIALYPDSIERVLRTMRARLTIVQLVNKTWRSVVQNVKYPSVTVVNEGVDYGVENIGFWYFLDSCHSEVEQQGRSDRKIQPLKYLDQS